MRSDEDLEQALYAILLEAIHFARMSLDELRPELAKNAFCVLKDAQGHNRIIGRVAYEDLRTLAEEALEASSFRGRVSVDRAFSFVRQAVGERYLGRRIEGLDGGVVRQDLEDAIARAGEECADRTHYVPCFITVPAGEAIELGPVRLRTTEPVVKRLQAEEEARPRHGGDPAATSSPRSFDEVRNYYLSFPDVAEVLVPQCDKPTSNAIAASAVQAALNYLHVLAGATYSDKLIMGGRAPSNDRRASLVRLSNGEFEMTTSVHFVGGANVSDEWWAEFRNDRPAAEAHRFGAVLDDLVNRREPQLLARKFLEACSWYGDAARERSSPASAVVKYLTAMECLLWADDKPFGVTKRLAARAAALCFSTQTWDFFELEAQIASAYELRSDIVHGRVGAGDPAVRHGLKLCEHISRDLIRTWAERFDRGFNQPVEMSRLRAYLDSFVRAAKADVRAAKANAVNEP